MRKSQIIENVLKKAADQFKKSVNIFWPAVGSNGFNERNLSFQFARMFMERKASNAYMEVPFDNKISQRRDLKFDAYMFDHAIGIILECKRLYNNIKYKEIIEDLERMNTANIGDIFENMYCIERRPKSIYAMILAESWSTDINNWWLGEKSKIKWDRSQFGKNMIFGFHEVGKRNQTFYWLYCYRKINL
jgi:hypothetical protein